jgi:hypothetical protein
VGGPFSLARSGGTIPSIGCMVPQPFVAGGNWPYLDFWAITGDPWYKTPTVALEPSVEWVARAGHSLGGRIGTYMMLQVSSRDSEV